MATLATVGNEKLSSQVLLGKQFFYDARDTRLARDRYMSCASCHNDGGQDGRVWDLTSQGEGLRNTINLRGRAGAHGHLHWSNNFDEVQDFEGQIRTLAGGSGLMNDVDFNSGTRNQPLGDAKAGVSSDLDALAAYLASLDTADPSPLRASDGNLSPLGAEGKAVFAALNCASCHSGTSFTRSAANNPADIGTLRPTSGQRLSGPLGGIDVPSLRDSWATAPYLHDGSAATLGQAVRRHNTVTIGDADLQRLEAFLQQIGSEEPSAPANVTGGLSANYFNNITLTGTPVLSRTEAVNFDWASGRPGATVNTDNFSVRWVGSVIIPASGNYQFRTVSDDGVRLWVNAGRVINNWTSHGAKADTSVALALVAGQRVPVTLEYYERTGKAVMKLQWLVPGATSFVAIPASSLSAN